VGESEERRVLESFREIKSRASGGFRGDSKV
jgi:hypothetical protein